MSQPRVGVSLAIAAVLAAAVFVISTLINGDDIRILWLVIAIVIACVWVAASHMRRSRAAR